MTLVKTEISDMPRVKASSRFSTHPKPEPGTKYNPLCSDDGEVKNGDESTLLIELANTLPVAAVVNQNTMEREIKDKEHAQDTQSSPSYDRSATRGSTDSPRASIDEGQRLLSDLVESSPNGEGSSVSEPAKSRKHCFEIDISEYTKTLSHFLVSHSLEYINLF